jgi:hypothetical protein
MGLVPSHLGAVSDRTGQVPPSTGPGHGSAAGPRPAPSTALRSGRCCPITPIHEGTNQIQRVVMARPLFKQQYEAFPGRLGQSDRSRRPVTADHGSAGPGLADHTQAVLSLVIAAVIADSAVPGVSVKDFCRAVISGLRSAFPGTEARWLSAVWSWVR